MNESEVSLKLHDSHSEWNEESCVYRHFEALAEKSTLHHTYGFLTFVRNDTLTPKILHIRSGWHNIHIYHIIKTYESSTHRR